MPLLDYCAFSALQARAERAGWKLRRYEAGGVVRFVARHRGVGREIKSIDDLEALINEIAAREFRRTVESRC